MSHRFLPTLLPLITVLIAAPALAEDAPTEEPSPPPADSSDVDPSDGEEAPAEEAPAEEPPAEKAPAASPDGDPSDGAEATPTAPPPPPADAFRAQRIDVAAVIEVNQLLRGRCFGPGYAARFTLVVEDEDADDVVLHAHGPQSSGRKELFELEFEAEEGRVEVDFLGEDDEEDVDLDEDEPLQVTLLWKDGTLTLREDDDEVFDVEPDEDDLEGVGCHILSWEVQEEFYVTGLEIQPIATR